MLNGLFDDHTDRVSADRPKSPLILRELSREAETRKDAPAFFRECSENSLIRYKLDLVDIGACSPLNADQKLAGCWVNCRLLMTDDFAGPTRNSVAAMFAVIRLSDHLDSTID
jgi:hypothetical protein